jgi:hypothetical protein
MAAYLSGSALRCSFLGNTCQYQGGGYYAYTHSFGGVSDCLFRANSATSYGGGAYVYFGGAIFNSTFVSNTTGYGGGAYLTGSGLFRACTFTGNDATWSGGGTYSFQGGEFDRCTYVGNRSMFGGGLYTADGGLVHESLIRGNLATDGGGGMYHSGFNPSTCRVVNCTVVGNVASNFGGGTYNGLLANCILVQNVAVTGANHDIGVLDYCCTTPMPLDGTGSITSAPVFMDAGAGDYRPAFGSPVINAGSTPLAAGSLDLLAAPRIVSSSVDIGAHEYDGARYDTDRDIMADAWEIQYGFNPTNGSDGAGHADGDGYSNRDEFIADTNPTNAADYFHVIGGGHTNSFSVVVGCSTARVYGLELSASLKSNVWNDVPGATGIPGDPSGTLTLTDPGHWNEAAYRVTVSLP